MKKKLFVVFFILVTFFMPNYYVNALTKLRVDYNDLNLRSGPGTNYTSIKKLGVSSIFDLADTTLYSNEKGCTDGWYKIYYSGTDVGYVCASYVTLVTIEETPTTATTDCEKEMQNLRFPNTYWNGLCALKEKYPNWTFEADKTNLPFDVAVEKESVVGKSLIQSSYQGYFSTESSSYDYLTDTFTVKEGKDWYAANSEVVAYYFDPRNFLDERYIFMFEKLSFDSSYQTVDAINAVLNGKDIQEKSSVIYNAGNTYDANAIYLASRIKQETGGNYSGYSLKGQSITVNNITYSPVYNPYNIGAFTGAYDGLVWAVSGTSYLRPWLTLDKAITGGANYITDKYISKGQNTSYFQKFNTSSYSQYAPYAHQYMTNIRGAANEASITYNGYKDMNLLSAVAFKFVIPVYENMPEKQASLPNGGNPNNHLKSLKVNNNELSGFSHDTFEYNYYVGSNINSVNISAETINDKATVEGAGKIDLTSDKTVIKIIVTAENKMVQNYIINIIKTEGVTALVEDIVASSGMPVSENTFLLSAGYTIEALTDLLKKSSSSVKIEIKNKNSGKLFTGDEITITNGSDLKIYVVSLKGDPSGDGNINIQDLLKVQKHILGYLNLAGSYSKAADVNSDGVIDIKDLLKIQKYILGYTTIN